MRRRGPCRGTKTYEIDGKDEREKRGRRGFPVVVVAVAVVGECDDDAQRVRDAEERSLRRFSEAWGSRPIQGTFLEPQ